MTKEYWKHFKSTWFSIHSVILVVFVLGPFLVASYEKSQWWLIMVVISVTTVPLYYMSLGDFPCKEAVDEKPIQNFVTFTCSWEDDRDPNEVASRFGIKPHSVWKKADPNSNNTSGFSVRTDFTGLRSRKTLHHKCLVAKRAKRTRL